MVSCSCFMDKLGLTFIMSSLSSSQRTNTEEEGERGSELAREETSWARRRALSGAWVLEQEASTSLV